MTADKQPVMHAAEQGTSPVDFQVPRTDRAHWTVEPVSALALMADNVRRPGCSIVAEHAQANAHLLALRSWALSILDREPARPITL
jgi:hypothetical protein